MKLYLKFLDYSELDYMVWDKGFKGIFNGSRRQMIRLIRSNIFDNFILFMVKNILRFLIVCI